MKDNFSNAIKFVIFWEKYRSDNPKDPGGLTIWGICRKDHPEEVEKMRTMTKEQSMTYASGIYRKEYWDAIEADNLPEPMDIVLFDICVNQGIVRAIEVMHTAIDWRDAIILRSDKYDDLKLYGIDGKGWNKRIVSLRDFIATGYKVLEWDRDLLIKAER